MVVENPLSEPPARKLAGGKNRSAGFVVLYLAVSFSVAWFFWFLSWLYTKGFVAHLPLTVTLIAGSFGPFVGAGVCSWFEGDDKVRW